jgi:peptidyl-prolyl cis-trans isomerase SurA
MSNVGKLLEDKLYAHQAIQDSVKVTDAEVKGMMEERLSYMVGQIGSMDKVIKYYKKSLKKNLEILRYFEGEKLSSKCKRKSLKKRLHQRSS